MKKRCLLSILLSIFSLCSLFSEESGKLFLWHIETDKAEAWLTGSIHILKEDFYPLPEIIEMSYTEAEYLVVEVDTISSDNQKIILKLFREKGFLRDGSTLFDILSPEQAALLTDCIENLDLNPEMFRYYRPWLMSMIIPVYQMMSAGYSEDLGMDVRFINKAKEDGKAVLELETAEYQISLLSDLDNDLQIEMLMDAVDTEETGTAYIEKMEQCWKSGDTETLNNILNTGFEGEHGDYLYDIMIRRRNIQMAKKIDSLLIKGGKYFIIVGAGHFTGNDSIISLLEKENYTVEQVSR